MAVVTTVTEPVTLRVGRATYRITTTGEEGPWRSRAFRVDVLTGEAPADLSGLANEIAKAYGVRWNGGYRFGWEAGHRVVVLQVG